ncbi:MAG: threonylcarbamoyl-AMP synthase [Clostridia bacterium]|nr:threonylcarbamoyl-AMP synthase [Clostridia bacterium]
MKTMMTQPTPESIRQAAQIIRDGGVVGFPTETVYGLGGDALSGEAAKRIFEAKGRPGDNPLIVHIASLSEIDPLIEGEMPEMARKLAEAYWPGPLTMIMKKSSLIPDEVSAGLKTVGIRLPANETARALIREAGRPIAAPSANRSGRPSPTTAKHVLDDMDGRIPMILDGGASEVGLESTVLDVTGEIPRVLRPGGVTPEMIAAVAGKVEVDGTVMRPLREGERPISPGTKYRHYAPEGDLTIVQGEEKAVAESICGMYDGFEKDAAILALPGHEHLYGVRRVYTLGTDGSVESAAAGLFAALRLLDDEKMAHIFSEAVPADGLGLAVMNRLGRAAAFHIVNV